MLRFDVKTEISRIAPDLGIERVRKLGEGMDTVAYEVNDQYVFRFAKHAKSSGWGEGLELEMKLLPELARQVDVQIPEILFSGRQSNGLPYVGYEKIAGEKLSSEMMGKLSKTGKDTVYTGVARFINQMQDFPVKKARSLGVRNINFRSSYESDSRKIREKVFPMLKKSTQEYLHDLLDKYLTDSKNFEYESCLLHADLWPEHVLVDFDTGDIIGVYDFGDVILGDPDYEFMQFYQVFGEEALSFFEIKLDMFDIDRARTKSQFFQKWNIVQDLMFYQDIGDSDGVEYNLGKIVSFAK